MSDAKVGQNYLVDSKTGERLTQPDGKPFVTSAEQSIAMRNWYNDRLDNRDGVEKPLTSGQVHFQEKVKPAIEKYLDAFFKIGDKRLYESRIMREKGSATDWLFSVMAQQPVWNKGRKTGLTAIQMLSQKDLWPTKEPGLGEDLRKSMLAAVKALRAAPGYSQQWVENIEQGRDSFDFGDKKETNKPKPTAKVEETPAWYTEIPTEGLPITEADKKPNGYRDISNKIASDAYDAISRDNLICWR